MRAGAFPLLGRTVFWRLGLKPHPLTLSSESVFLAKQCLSHRAACPPTHTHMWPELVQGALPYNRTGELFGRMER